MDLYSESSSLSEEELINIASKLEKETLSKLAYELKEKLDEVVDEYGNPLITVLAYSGRPEFPNPSVVVIYSGEDEFGIPFELHTSLDVLLGIEADKHLLRIKREEIEKKAKELNVPEEAMKDKIIYNIVAQITAYDKILRNPEIFDKIKRDFAIKVAGINDVMIGRYRGKLEEVS